MGVSKRADILQAIVTALKAIKTASGYLTTVKYVSTQFDIKHPQELNGNQLPACFPIDDTESKEGFAIFSDEADNLDTKSVLTVLVTSIVYSRTGDTVTPRTKLLVDVEKAIVTNTTLFNRATGTGLLLEPASPSTVETDKGFFGKYSVFDQAFLCEYAYNHTSP